jgi:hypothetical protein
VDRLGFIVSFGKRIDQDLNPGFRFPGFCHPDDVIEILRVVDFVIRDVFQVCFFVGDDPVKGKIGRVDIVVIGSKEELYDWTFEGELVSNLEDVYFRLIRKP